VHDKWKCTDEVCSVLNIHSSMNMDVYWFKKVYVNEFHLSHCIFGNESLHIHFIVFILMEKDNHICSKYNYFLCKKFYNDD
jgi:hypothetical protein